MVEEALYDIRKMHLPCLYEIRRMNFKKERAIG